MRGKARAQFVTVPVANAHCPSADFHYFPLQFESFLESFSFTFPLFPYLSSILGAAGAGDLPSLAAPVMATPLAPLAPAAPPLAPLAPLAAPAAAQAPVEPLQTPGSAVQLQEAAQLRGGICSTTVIVMPMYSKCGGLACTNHCNSLDRSSSVICLQASL